MSASASTSIPASRAARVVSGPIDTAGMPVPSAAKARAAEGEASTTRSPSGVVVGDELARPVERDEVGVELVDEQSPRALGRREQTPGRPVVGSSASSPSCVETRGTRSAPPSASAVARPIAATRGSGPEARRRSSRAPFALVTTTQS